MCSIKEWNEKNKHISVGSLKRLDWLFVLLTRDIIPVLMSHDKRENRKVGIALLIRSCYVNIKNYLKYGGNLAGCQHLATELYERWIPISMATIDSDDSDEKNEEIT